MQSFCKIWFVFKFKVWFLTLGTKVVKKSINPYPYLLGLLLLAFDCTLILRNHTFRSHTNWKAFLQPTLLALPTHVHINFAIVSILALVNGIFGDTPTKEAFASFAGEGVIMITRRPVTADQTKFFLLPRSWAFFLFRITAIYTVTVQRTGWRKVVPSWKRKKKLLEHILSTFASS